MAESILRAWWDRLRGRLRPHPCPYSLAGALEMPGRRWVAGPRRVMRDFGLSTGEIALEIGPGTGFYSIEAANRVGPSGKLICLDVQPDMLRHARRRLEAAGRAAHLVQADARALPLRSLSVDRVLLVTILGEIPDRSSALAEVKRVLRQHGRLSVSEQFPDPDFVTPAQLRRELSAAGFVEERTKGWLWYTSTWTRPPQAR
jgi:ubiquinone/menaquinone biosynthesis C-methylase UbiE